MAYIKTTWKDRLVERPNTFEVQENPDGTITLIPTPGTVTQAGTPVNATNLNKIEDGIVNLENATAAHLAENATQGNPHGIDAKANKVQETWIIPALQNGWAQDAGGRPISYYKDTLGRVHIEGRAAGGTLGLLFTLPVGYRPSTQVVFEIGQKIIIIVQPTGNVNVYSAPDPPVINVYSSFRA